MDRKYFVDNFEVSRDDFINKFLRAMYDFCEKKINKSVNFMEAINFVLTETSENVSTVINDIEFKTYILGNCNE